MQWNMSKLYSETCLNCKVKPVYTESFCLESVWFWHVFGLLWFKNIRMIQVCGLNRFLAHSRFNLDRFAAYSRFNLDRFSAYSRFCSDRFSAYSRFCLGRFSAYSRLGLDKFQCTWMYWYFLEKSSLEGWYLVHVCMVSAIYM